MAKTSNVATEIKVGKEVMQLLLNQQFVKEAPVYEEDEMLVSIPTGLYTVSAREVAATANSKAWTAYEAHFVVNKKPIVIRYRSGVKPNEDADLQVVLFRANRNWPATGEPKVKKDETKVFCINAKTDDE